MISIINNKWRKLSEVQRIMDALNLQHSFLQPCIKRASRIKYPIAAFSFLVRRNRHSTAVNCLSKAAEAPAVRRFANYHPTLWEDSYIQSLATASQDDSHMRRWEELKEEIRKSLGKQTSVVDQIELVDYLLQLGVSYHFEAEIESLLSSFICSSTQTLELIKNDLHANALLFRLLREYGFHNSQISAEVLIGCLKNENGSFKENFDNDVKGLLSLYESSFLALEGEGELDDAREFVVKKLCYIRESSLHHNPKIVEIIDYALEQPLHWRMSRVHTMWFIKICKNNYQMDPFLLEFAKLDFNMVQSIYIQELKDMSRWWSGLMCDELSFSRDRLAEHHFWTIGFNYAPQFGACRKGVTKANCLITLMDDIYDLYGSIDELELFTKAVEEWKITDDKQLPNYMKTCLTTLFDTMNDISNKVILEKGLNILPYLKHAWVDIAKSYLIEAKWYHSGHTPSLHDYLENGWITIGGSIILITAYCLSNDLTKEDLNNLEFYSNCLRLSSILIRLNNDLGTSSDEIKRGDVPKSIQCQMNKENVSEPIARDHIRDIIAKTWKELNGERITSSDYPKAFEMAVVGMPRASQCFYQNSDGHGKSGYETRDRIMSIVVEPILFE